MKKALAVFLLCCVLGCGGGPQIHRSGVLFIGDSIFSRWDLNAYFPGRGYVDGGIEGQRTDQILARLPDALAGANICTGVSAALKCSSLTPPQTVIIYAGWNNLFQATGIEQAPLDIRKMAAMCILSGAHPVLVTLYRFDPAFYPAPGQEPFSLQLPIINQEIRDVGKLYGIPVVDLEQVFAGQSGYTSDGVHPVASGYAQMREAIAPVLK